jgi:hypothetical protein
MRWVPVPITVVSALIGCTYIQDFQVPDGPPDGNGDGGGSEASCASPTDPNNCGACGHSCLAGACVSGVCQPVVLAEGQGDSSWVGFTSDIGDPLVGPDRLAADDTDVYWLNLRGEVMRVPISGGQPERVARTDRGPAWIVLDGDQVYFSTLAGDVFRVPKSGGTPARLAPGPGPAIDLFSGPFPTELFVAAGKITFANGKGLVTCPVSGCPSQPEVIDSGRTDYRPFSYAVDGAGRMYASEENHTPSGPNSESVDYTMTANR